MTPFEWIMSNDTGISSKTIWYAMMGEIKHPMRCGQWDSNFDIPHDPDDFGRCYRLLKLFPEWRKNLDKVSAAFPKWKPMVDRWSEMESLWREESPSGVCPKLFVLMSELVEECRIADGWVKTGRGSWERKEHESD